MKPILTILGFILLLLICKPKHEHVTKRYYINEVVYTMTEYCTTTDMWVINGEHL